MRPMTPEPKMWLTTCTPNALARDDPNQLAKSIGDIATGQKPDRDPTPEEQGKDPAAVAMGKKGGKARADGMSSARRKQIASEAAAKRWGK